MRKLTVRFLVIALIIALVVPVYGNNDLLQDPLTILETTAESAEKLVEDVELKIQDTSGSPDYVSVSDYFRLADGEDPEAEMNDSYYYNGEEYRGLCVEEHVNFYGGYDDYLRKFKVSVEEVSDTNKPTIQVGTWEQVVYILNTYLNDNGEAISGYTNADVQRGVWYYTSQQYHDTYATGTYLKSDAIIADAADKSTPISSSKFTIRMVTTLGVYRIGTSGSPLYKLDGETETFYYEALPTYIDDEEVSHNQNIIIIDPKPVSKTYQLGDYVWFDEDYDGVQDLGETYPSDAVVRAYLQKWIDGKYEDQANTLVDSTGKYLFGRLGEGTYRVRFVIEEGDYSYTIADQTDDDAVDSDAVTDSDFSDPAYAVTTHDVTFDDDKPLQEDLTFDAGLVTYYELGDYVWLDTNKDGRQDETESYPKDAHVVAYLYKMNSKEEFVDSGLPGQPVDDNGYYHFSQLPAGYYQVKFVIGNSKYEYTKFDNDDNGNLDHLDSDAEPTKDNALVAFTTHMRSFYKGTDIISDDTFDAGLVLIPQSTIPSTEPSTETTTGTTESTTERRTRNRTTEPTTASTTNPTTVAPTTVNITTEPVPQGAPDPSIEVTEEVIPLGAVLPKTGEESNLFFYFIGIGLIGLGVATFRRKITN